MRKILIYLAILNVSNTSYAQGIDNLWLLGYGGGATNINFISSSPNIYSTNRMMNISVTLGLITDNSGNLLFYSNGCYIANALNDTMYNGNGLNPNSCALNVCPYGNTITDGNIVIPDPGNPNRYYLFHETCSWISPSFEPTELYYSVIDMTQQGGLGAVVQKNVVILNSGTLNWGFLTAVKHANGRDWWIAVHKLGNNLFHTLLLTPDGLQGPFTQSIGTSFQFSAGGQTVFSPDGSKLATSTWGFGNGLTITLFEFDRCTGQFRNEMILDSINIGTCGIAFSPNSRFLYCTPLDSIIQYDMNANNISSSKIKVAMRDSFTYFQFAELAYNQKIYIISGGSSFSSIENPDSLGLACNVQMNSIHLPHINHGTIPNYPNYRLGPVIGSVCDSLTGINDKNAFQLSLKVFPNPSATGIFHFQFNDIREQIQDLEISDVSGRIVFAIKKNIYKVNISGVSSGIYFYSVITKAGKKFKGKLIRD